MKYFVFNKTSDYTRGYMEHLTASASGLASETGFFGRAVFFSRVLDSGKKGTIWHRMIGKRLKDGSAAIRISFYTSEEIELEIQGKSVDLREVMRSKEFSISEKKECFQPFLRKELTFGTDMLLHSLDGRYFWFLLEIYPQTEESVELGEFMISFQAQSWTAYLPELYQREMGNNSFLDRYLSIFQSLYDDLGTQIREIPKHLDPETAKREFLEWLAEWLDIEDPYMWNERQLRFLLEHAMEFQAARGTRRGIELFVELYTGEKPFVIEWQDWSSYRNASPYGKLLGELYADDPGCFTVLVQEACIPAYQEHQTLLRILEQIKPVQMEVNLIVLKPYIFADGYSYLGVNSVLGQYERAALGGNSRLAFATVTGNEERSDS